MPILEVQNENPVVLQGYLDATGALQLEHEDGALVDHSQTLHAIHDTATTITIELHDFDSWQLDAVHGTGTTWARALNHAYCTFAEVMTDPITVTVAATSGTQTRSRNIYVKTKPKGSLPAR
jgi:hypothetical protein